MAKATPLQCPFCDTYLRSPIDINFKDIESENVSVHEYSDTSDFYD